MNKTKIEITVNKISVISIAVAFNIAAYFYISDRGEIKEFMKSMTDSVHILVTNDKLSSAWAVNVDARIIKQEENLDKLYEESRIYWRHNQ